MKTLYMVRHAKSSWKHDLIDHERPLKGRGNRDAKLVSEYIATKVKEPEQIICSDANRALSTARYFYTAFGLEEAKFNSKHELYDFSGQQVLNVIKGLDDSWETVMIVGHNHAFTSLANMLGNDQIDNLPTCGFVEIQFKEKRWGDINTGNTIRKVFPKDLKE
jgi:phosphohistidine phosphatase